jgi:patatin-like phospholipase/acyl hydrolase
MSSEFQLPSRAPQEIAARPFQILCLSGGGYRGLYTAALLEKLENAANKPLSKIFDMIAGTSIGGILALGLGCGLSAARLRKAFETNAERIFPQWYQIKGKNIFPRFRQGIFKARYPLQGLRDTIAEILGDKRNAKIHSGMATQLLITSVNLTARTACLFRSTDTECNASLIDIALATSAAPTYFPEHMVDSTIMIDGGLVANAPDMLCVIEALKSAKLDEIRVLSIGTAGGEGANAYREPENPGAQDCFRVQRRFSS